MNLKQTPAAPKPKTYVLDQKTHKKVWIAKPVPSWQGGEPEYLCSEIRDFLHSPGSSEVSILIFDSWSTHSDAVLDRACEVTASAKQKDSRTFGGFVGRDKAQYMFTQGVIGRGLYDLASTGKRSIHLSHVAEINEESIIGSGDQREKVVKPIAYGFQSSGRAQIKALTKLFSPGLVHLGTESKGFGAKATVEHTAYLQKHGNPPFFAKWQNTEAPPSLSIEGQAGCESFWEMVLGTVKDGPFNIGIYGEPGDGKTTLALTLWPEFWQKDSGVALYVACDPSSEGLPTAWPGTVR